MNWMGEKLLIKDCKTLGKAIDLSQELTQGGMKVSTRTSTRVTGTSKEVKNKVGCLKPEDCGPQLAPMM